MHNNVFEFFYKTGAPTQVEDGDFRLNTRFLEHSSVASPPDSQKKKKKKKSHKPCSPYPKYCLLFLGTSDDHPVRSPVWPLSISSLFQPTVSNSSSVITKVNAGFSQGKQSLDLDQVERDFCSVRQAYAHAQQEEVTEERDLHPNSQEAS